MLRVTSQESDHQQCWPEQSNASLEIGDDNLEMHEKQITIATGPSDIRLKRDLEMEQTFRIPNLN